LTDFSAPPSYSPPLNFTWNGTAVNPIVNQSPFGWCWAFSATAALEGARVAVGNASLVKLSERQMVECSNTFPQTHAPRNGSHLPSGNTQSAAWAYACSDPNNGQCLEAVIPFTNDPISKGCDTQCQGMAKPLRWGYLPGPSTPVHVTQYALQLYGTLSVGIHGAGAPCFQYYRPTGELNPSWLLDPVNCPVPSSGGGHAIAIIGWVALRNATSNETVTGWIVRNSWGRDWGDGGYFYVKAGSNWAGIENAIQAVTHVYVAPAPAPTAGPSPSPTSPTTAPTHPPAAVPTKLPVRAPTSVPTSHGPTGLPTAAPAFGVTTTKSPTHTSTAAGHGGVSSFVAFLVAGALLCVQRSVADCGPIFL